MNRDSLKDYYKILEVDRNASQEVITMSYKSLAKKYHPDLNLNSNLNKANEKMKDINEAYNILNNVESRTKYNVIYDSYMKDTINNINNAYNSYMSEEIKKEGTKIEKLKISSLFKLNKRNIVIASIIAILLIYGFAERMLVSSDYASIHKIQMDISINIAQMDRMKANVNNKHVNYSDNNSENPDKKIDSHHDMHMHDTSKQDEIYSEKVGQLEYLTEEVQAPSALIHRLFN